MAAVFSLIYFLTTGQKHSRNVSKAVILCYAEPGNKGKRALGISQIYTSPGSQAMPLPSYDLEHTAVTSPPQ